MTEIADFAAALRQMADNAEYLAERHDVAEVAVLRALVEEQAAKAQRDSDLIDELRRQVGGTVRALDAIGQMRRHVLNMKAPDAVQVFTDALLIIAGTGCSNYTSRSCRDASSGRTRTAAFSAEAWCQECVAADALERAGLAAGIRNGEDR